MNDLDWNQIRAFAAVARHGSLTAAAAATGLSQPTLSRRIDALERALGATLFVRGRSGAALTDTGAALVARADAMEREAGALVRAAAGRRETPRGEVRVTASRIVSAHLLPPILSALAISHPEIDVELVPSDEVADLSRRDADLAVRMARPSQPDLIARRLGALPLGAYAALSYVERAGMPEPTPEGLMAHRLVGYDRSPLIIDGMRAAGIAARREDFALRCDDQAVYLALVAAGGGIGFLARTVAEAAGLVRIPLPVEVPPLEVWLAAHRDLRTSAAVRAVADAVAAYLPRRLGPS